MKLFVWILVLLNVGILAYFNIDLIAPKPASIDHSIQPEKLKLVDEKALATMPKVAGRPSRGLVP